MYSVDLPGYTSVDMYSRCTCNGTRSIVRDARQYRPTIRYLQAAARSLICLHTHFSDNHNNYHISGALSTNSCFAHSSFLAQEAKGESGQQFVQKLVTHSLSGKWYQTKLSCTRYCGSRILPGTRSTCFQYTVVIPRYNRILPGTKFRSTCKSLVDILVLPVVVLN